MVMFWNIPFHQKVTSATKNVYMKQILVEQQQISKWNTIDRINVEADTVLWCFGNMYYLFCGKVQGHAFLMSASLPPRGFALLNSR